MDGSWHPVGATMFGFLKLGSYPLAYRQVYAAYCAHQRRRYGVLAALFTSYEATFLYLVALERGDCPSLSPATPRCCRLHYDSRNRWGLDEQRADFCAAFAILLGETKLRDDVRDSGSLTAQLLLRLLRRQWTLAHATLDLLAPGLRAEITAEVTRHHQLEARPGDCDPDEYARPTANAFGCVFAAFGQLNGGSPTVVGVWRTLGERIGTGIVLADCLADRARDRRQGTYNPLRTNDDVLRARQSALSAWSAAGWSCPAPAVGGHLTRRVLRAAFDRVARQTTAVPPRALRRSAWRIWRRGVCDCDCGLCDIPADCGGDCPPGCGDDSTGAMCVDCCSICDPGGYNSNCCDTIQRASRPESEIRSRREPDEDTGDDVDGGVAAPRVQFVAGVQGTSQGPLQPTGVVRINDQELPAKALHAWIDAGRPVQVVRADAFGVLVREQVADDEPV